MQKSGSSSSAARSFNADDVLAETPKRSAFTWLALCFILFNSAWAVYHYQYERLPAPLTAEQAGKRGFSEYFAMDHVEALTRLGPHPVGSDALELAVQYVLTASENIKKTAHWEVDIQLDLFHAKSGANRLAGGLFKGKTLVYSDLKHVVLRILPKYLPEAEESTILVSSHIDTVFSSVGAGDCSSCVAVMLELARAVSQWAHGFKKSVIFLFNTGEEDGLNGAHSFITQHPWSRAICLAVDLEAMGIGGKSGIFQSGPDPWAIESFARAAKYPSAQIIGQDLFVSGVIKSATDYEVYSELAGLSGLDFAFTDVVAVYHTKNDKLSLLKAGSLQHLGDNMLAFLLQTAAASYTPGRNEVKMREGNVYNQMVYFDVLGTYMVFYSERLANLLHNSLIVQGLLIWVTSLFVGGCPAVISLFLSVLSVVLMWMFSLSLAVPVAFLVPKVSSSPVPYIANPLLVLGLFGAPAVLGALIGQQIGYHILQKYLLHASLRNSVKSLTVQIEEVKWEAERWLFKAGFLQWLLILLAGNIYKVGSSYVALVWLVSPAFAYGLIEATLTPMRSPKPLRIVTLILGLSVPVLISAGAFIRMMGTMIGILVRLDRNPGSTPEWLGSVVLATIMVAIVCLTFVYVLSYAHLSGARRAVILATCAVFSLTIGMISAGFVHPFTDDVARAIHVVHVVDTTGGYNETQNPVSYISLFSYTPGKLTKEAESLKDEGFVCGKDKVLDLVTFSVEYGCYSSYDTEHGWSETEIPILQVESDLKEDARITRVSLDTKVSTRWTLAINTREIEDFKFEGNSEKLIPLGNKTGVDGWHIIQFAGGKNAPTKYEITLFWFRNSTHPTQKKDERQQNEDSHLLLKLRTDVNRITPKTARVLEKLPSWCSLFGKSTSPYTLAFLTGLPVEI